ncbi:MAG: RNA-dependent RNA polymerase [Sanya totivirus 3]|nr:MAG: RNA-dependent RNA polymerase [Sanya totivirus 3]
MVCEARTPTLTNTCPYCRLPAWGTAVTAGQARVGGLLGMQVQHLQRVGLEVAQLIVNNSGEVFTLLQGSALLQVRKLAIENRMDLILRCSPATAPVEWRRRLVPYHLDCSHIADVQGVCPTDALDLLTTFSSYQTAPAGLREIYQVHPVFVAKWRPERAGTLWELYTHNRHMVAYEHAALFMWWAAMPEHIYQFCLGTKLHMVNLKTDGGQLGTLLELCRQQATAGGGITGEEAFLWLRKYKNLYGRERKTCDTHLEEERYHPNYSRRTLGLTPCRVSRGEYLHLFTHHARRVARRLVNRVMARKIDSVREWWGRRINTLASGSSSNRHLVDRYKSLDAEITRSDRPNKKAIAEILDDQYIWRVLRTVPHMVARRSTKNEPGLKQRALYAVDDEAVIISAYASHNMEKAMDFGGMCPLQRPADVVKWWRAGQKMAPGEVWLSADYTDFNKEHSANELYLLNLAVAEAWCTQAPDTVATRGKIAASLWVAKAQKNRYVKTEDQRLMRVFSALFSGSRDTARDNTLLHCIYHNMVQSWLQAHYPEWGHVHNAFMCGDDEDVKLSDPIAAAYYYMAMITMGWHANDAKQMCGREHHEFLQKFPHPTRGCVGPIASMIAALCSGQWYVKPGLQQDNALTSMSDQLWELVVRGADMSFIYPLSIDLFNDYMQVKDNVGNKKKLEWWAFRRKEVTIPSEYVTANWNKADSTAALWGNVGGAEHDGQDDRPGIFFYVQSARALPHRGSAAWCKRWFPLFEKHGATDLFPQYVLNMKANSYGSLYHTAVQKRKKQWLLDQWPTRRTETQKCYSTIAQRVHEHKKLVSEYNTKYANLLDILRTEGDRAVPETLPQRLAQAGADMHMFSLLGGERNHVLCAELGLLARRKQPLRSWLQVHQSLRSAHSLLDPALRSYLNSTGPSI